MAYIYLGLTESAIDPLPPIRWMNGGPPGIPTAFPSPEEAVMLDGTVRVNFKSRQPRSWALQWEMLTAAEWARMVALKLTNRSLYFQNNWEDATWRLVAIVDLTYDPYLNAGPVGCRYGVTMKLKELR